MFDRGDFYRAWLWNKPFSNTKRGRLMQMTQDSVNPFKMLMAMNENIHPELNSAGQRTSCRIMWEFDEFMINTRLRNRVMKRWCEFARLDPNLIPKTEPYIEDYYAIHGYGSGGVPQKLFNETKPLDATSFYSTLLGIPT